MYKRTIALALLSAAVLSVGSVKALAADIPEETTDSAYSVTECGMERRKPMKNGMFRLQRMQREEWGVES